MFINALDDIVPNPVVDPVPMSIPFCVCCG